MNVFTKVRKGYNKVKYRQMYDAKFDSYLINTEVRMQQKLKLYLDEGVATMQTGDSKYRISQRTL